MNGMGKSKGAGGHMARCPLCGGQGAVSPEQAAAFAPAPAISSAPPEALVAALRGGGGGGGGGMGGGGHGGH
jgi:hypothetical protein